MSKINKHQQVLAWQAEKEQETWTCHEHIASKKASFFQKRATEITGKMEAVGSMSPDFIKFYEVLYDSFIRILGT